MNEEQTLIYWGKWLKGKEALIRQCCEEINNADTSEERNFYHRVYDLIQNKDMVSFDDYLSKFYIKKLYCFINKKTRVITSLEEIKQRYNWYIENSP